MSRIRFIGNAVEDTNKSAEQYMTNVSNTQEKVNRLTASIDHRVRARGHIDDRVHTIRNGLDAIENKLKQIHKFVGNAVGEYDDAEKFIIQRSYKFSSSLWDQYEYVLANDPHRMMAHLGSQMGFFAGTARTNTILRYNGMQFKAFKRNGVIYIKMIKGNMPSGQSWRYNHYRNSLVDLLGGDNGTFHRRFLERMINGGGIPLYTKHGGVISNNLRTFQTFGSVGDYVRGASNIIGRAGKSLTNTFVGGFAVWEDFIWKNTTNLSKIGKSLGAAGTILTIGNNFVETFRETGEWSVTGGKVRDFVVSTGVDFAAGAGAMAMGAAAGSFIAPPIGTVVGIGVGAGINFAMNAKWGGPPPKSVVDHTKDFAKDLAENSVEKISDGISSVGKNLGKLFW